LRRPWPDDRIVLTNGQGNWDKENRALLELCPCTDLARSEPEAELLLLKRTPQLEESTASELRPFMDVIQKIGRLF